MCLFLRKFFQNLMESNGNICHSGIVKSVEKHRIIVSIISQAACVSCHAKGACTASDIKEKEIEISQWQGNYSPGDQVEIVSSESQGFVAIFFAYILPLVLMVSTLVLIITFTKNEGFAAIGSLAILVPYYFILFLLRLKLRKTLKFNIRKQLNIRQYE
jgi:sigma-E factor negative regulatory protein RseC